MTARKRRRRSLHQMQLPVILALQLGYSLHDRTKQTASLNTFSLRSKSDWIMNDTLMFLTVFKDSRNSAFSSLLCNFTLRLFSACFSLQNAITTSFHHLFEVWNHLNVLVRLVGGANARVGRLEVLHNGVWGSVCGDYFSDEAARVVCTMLGVRYASCVQVLLDLQCHITKLMFQLRDVLKTVAVRRTLFENVQ